MKRLILTGLESLPHNREVEYVGPWALPAAKLADCSWKNYQFHRPFESEELREIAAAAEQASEYLLDRLCEYLNNKHGSKHARRYWRILLMSWLITLVHVAFERYLRIRNFVESGCSYEVFLVPSRPGSPIKNTRHFATLLMDHPLNHLIFSRIIRTLKPSGWIFHEKELGKNEGYLASDQKRAQKLEMLLWFSIFMSWLGGVLFYNILGMGVWNHAWLSLQLGMRKLFRRRANKFSQLGKKSEVAYSRANVAEKLEACSKLNQGEGERFLQIIEELSIELLPETFDAKFHENERRAFLKAKFSPKAPTIVCGPVIGRDESAKFYIAHLVEDRGAPLAITQHGGNYGLLEVFSYTNQVEYQVCDHFLSWGWERQSDYGLQAVPVPSPLLSRMNRKTPADSAPAIFVGTQIWTYLRHMDSILFPEDTEKYREDKVAFIQTLEEGPRAALLYRPYIDKIASAYDVRFMRARIPGISILEGRLNNELPHCRICIVDHPGTTAFLTLAARIPTLLFWDENVWRMKGSARKAVTKLRDVGVFHANPKSAARHLNDIWADIDGWWKDAGTQRAVDLFSREYCRSSKSWGREWLELFPAGEFLGHLKCENLPHRKI